MEYLALVKMDAALISYTDIAMSGHISATNSCLLAGSAVCVPLLHGKSIWRMSPSAIHDVDKTALLVT